MSALSILGQSMLMPVIAYLCLLYCYFDVGRVRQPKTKQKEVWSKC